MRLNVLYRVVNLSIVAKKTVESAFYKQVTIWEWCSDNC